MICHLILGSASLIRLTFEMGHTSSCLPYNRRLRVVLKEFPKYNTPVITYYTIKQKEARSQSVRLTLLRNFENQVAPIFFDF